MRSKPRRQSRKLYAAGYLKAEARQSGIGRHAVLAVCNIVAATGLLGLLSYSLLIDGRPDTEAPPDTASIDIEQTRAVSVPPLRSSFASLTPRLGDASTESAAAAGAPLITLDTVRPRTLGNKQSAPEPVAIAAVSTTDPHISVADEVRRVVIGSEPEAQQAIRVASLGSVADVLPDSTRGTTGSDLSVGSLFQEPRSGKSSALTFTTPAPAAVPLTRRDSDTDVLTLSFAVPPFVVRDVDSEARADLMRAEEVARKVLAEKTVTKDRRVKRERYCMAAAIYYEARGEPLSGQKAVAQVVLNRVADSRYPDTICGVVFQNEDRRHRCQFSFACDGKPERPKPGKSWTQALEIAEAFEEGAQVSSLIEATHYHADYVRPRWSRHRDMTRLRKIGRHIFYNES